MRGWITSVSKRAVSSDTVGKWLVAGVFVAGIALISPAHASLSTSFSYVGDYASSTGGCGSTSQTCSFSESVPTGSTVTAAYLYSSLYNEPSGGAPGGTLNGTTVNYATALGVNSTCDCQAYRSDVTGIVQSAVGGGSASPISFTVTETNDFQDGEGLVIVYSNPAITTTQSVGILDGFSASGGDTATINFTDPLEPTTTPGFQSKLIIGDGYSYDGSPCGSDPGQYSNISVGTNSTPATLLTDGAGCNDNSVDATPANGNLITVGNINAACPGNLATGNEGADIAADHENYCLNSYINDGDTSITTYTNNPSGDDNIFLEVFQISGSAGFNAPPPPPPPPPSGVPEPASLTILGASLFGLVMTRRRSRS